MFVCVIIYCHVNYKKAHQHTFSFGRRINTFHLRPFIFYQLVSHIVDTASVAVSTLSWEEMGDATASWRCSSRAGMSSWWAACRLLRIVEGLHHPVTLIARALFWEQKVILKHLLSSLLRSTIVLEVLHEARLSVSHIVWRLCLWSLLWIVESCCCGVGIGGKVVTIFTHGHETCIMLCTIAVKLWYTCHGATSVRELTSSISFWLVESVSSAVCSWFATAWDSCKVASILTIADS